MNTKATKLFIQHFKNINSPELERKWKQKYLDFCIKPTVNKKTEKMLNNFKTVIELKNKNLSVKEIAKILNLSDATIYRYYKLPKFLKMEEQLKETKALDSGEENIEE